MKKLNALMAICLCLTLVTPAFAQKGRRTNVDLGLKLGANFTQINGKYWENGYKANYLVGAFFAVNGGRAGLQIEGLFSQNTYKTGDGFKSLYQEAINPNNYKDSNGTFKVSYINIPVLLNIKLAPSFMLQVGPQFNGIVSIEDKDKFLKDAESVFKSDFAGVIGLWLNLPAHFNVGARYVMGLSEVNKKDFNDPNTGKSIDDAWKGRSLQVHIGFTFL